jgi:hypothetical protein
LVQKKRAFSFFFIIKINFILKKEMKKQDAALIHFLVFIIFVGILIFSVYQYLVYKKIPGTVVCSKKMNQCLLSYMDDENQINKVLPFETLGVDGLFQVQLCSGENSDSVIILGARNDNFFGTPFRITFYSVLSLITLVSFYFFRIKFTQAL